MRVNAAKTFARCCLPPATLSSDAHPAAPRSLAVPHRASTLESEPRRRAGQKEKRRGGQSAERDEKEKRERGSQKRGERERGEM